MASRLPGRSQKNRTKNWPAIAAALAAAIPRERLDPAVLAWATKAPRRGGWGVAFSGGADSLALLLLLWAHWPERRRTLRALHFNHRLRGRESSGDAAFCRRVCAKLGVTFAIGEWAGAHPAASEAEARAARMVFFGERSQVVWLGHQQDDVAETMLMRLARGSGAAGLAAPRPVQTLPGKRVHLRPLLPLKKAEIVEVLQKVGAVWREDSSNAGDRFFRNRIRREVLAPWIRTAQRDALAGAARSRLLLEEDDSALEAWLDALKPLDRRGVLDLATLRGQPRALWRRGLHRWFLAQPKVGEISRVAFEALLDAVERGRSTRHSVGSAGFAVTDGAELWFESAGKRRRNFQRSAN